MKNVFFLFFFLLFISCTQQEKDPFQACKDFEKADQEMRELFDEINERYKDDKVFLALFKDAHVRWIQYRIRRVRALYPRDWDRHYREKYGRETFNSCKCKENLRLTQLRVEELSVYLDGNTNEYKDCPVISNEQ
jgi:hypothetical protein